MAGLQGPSSFAILSASFTARAFAPLKSAGLPVTFAEWVTASVKG
jgi:hypothetical protein